MKRQHFPECSSISIRRVFKQAVGAGLEPALARLTGECLANLATPQNPNGFEQNQRAPRSRTATSVLCAVRLFCALQLSRSTRWLSHSTIIPPQKNGSGETRTLSIAAKRPLKRRALSPFELSLPLHKMTGAKGLEPSISRATSECIRRFATLPNFSDVPERN